MKINIFIVAFKVTILQMFMSSMLYGQSNNESVKAKDENQFLLDNSSKENFFSKLNAIPLSHDNQSILRIGGEFRERFRGFYNINYGDDDPDEDTYLMQRYNIYTDFQINNTFRFFAEISTSHVNNKNEIRSSDHDNLGVAEVFLDIAFSSFPLNLRIGRQELGFGSGTMLGKRDGPNNPKKFDGILNTIHFNKITGDIFAAYPMNYEPGFFDNTMDRNNLIYGTYWAFPLKNNHVIDIYYFGSDSKDAEIKEVISEEKRHTLGTRISNSNVPFFYNAEATWQFGKFGKQDISAWQLIANVGYSWQGTRLNPEVQLKGSLFSSEKDSTDNKLNLFRQISGRPPVNRMLSVGPANIMLLAPSGRLDISDKINFSITYYAVWRRKTSDGIYSRSMSSMIRPPDSGDEEKGRYIAGGPYLGMRYDTSEHIKLSFNYGIFYPGEYLKNTGMGKNYQGFTLTAQYVF